MWYWKKGGIKMDMLMLVKLAKQKDNIALEEIFIRFKPLVIKLSNNVFINGYEQEDLIQMGYASIMKAIDKFDENKNNNFVAYVRSAIQKNYYNEIRQKCKVNYEASLNKVLDESTEFIDFLEDDFDLEKHILYKDQCKRLREALKLLSPEDREILMASIDRQHGGLRTYANNKGLKYSKCRTRKEALMKKLKRVLE